MSLFANAIRRGTRAGQPAANTVIVGTLYFVTDELVTERSTGAAWESYSDGGSPPAPVNAEYVVEAANGTLTGEVVLGSTVITTAAYGSRQAAAKAGRLFLPNNGFVVERDTGAAWAPWGPLFPFTAPVDGDFAWINQGGATVSTTNGGIYLFTPKAAANSWRIRKKAAPATPYTITIAFLSTLVGLANQRVGLVFRQSSDGKLHAFYLLSAGAAGDLSLVSDKWTSETVFSATYGTIRPFYPGAPIWLRIADDGANRICSYSADGINFLAYHSIGRTDFLTADEVGFAASDSGNAYDIGMTLLSWKQA